jgi:hypothetical protein
MWFARWRTFFLPHHFIFYFVIITLRMRQLCALVKTYQLKK